ncbi:MAG TPA: HlyD family efflux transporter periplasmic adaptor subunit [Rhodanobacteraceae bacterium]|nr:HlyD family efflux transporter periplasmic adaptor subunit [Rhodanobacteraceae bacterium]
MRHGVLASLAALFALAAAGCSDAPQAQAPTEVVRAAPLQISVRAEGELRAAEATPLLVPGRQWSRRQLVWMLPDGTRVKKGELVARFGAEQSKQDLAAALIDLERNMLARMNKQAELAENQGTLKVNLSQVASQLAIAERYANAGFDALSRNEVLDAIQDTQFLTTKQDILQWRRAQTGSRGQAELAVIDAKRATFQLKAKQQREDLDALELRAPHAGILMLQTDWSGQKPQVGANLFAGRPFANLPDLASMEVTLAVPQVQAHGLHTGLAVELHPLGAPEQSIQSTISWVAAAAAPRSRESPVKYLSVKASVPAAAIQRYGWVPAQRFVGRIVLLDAKAALSVPNLAIDSHGSEASVQVRAGGSVERRTVKLGVRGASRSQVLDGLKPGEHVLLDVGGHAP